MLEPLYFQSNMNDLNDWNLFEILKKVMQTNDLDELFFTNDIMESYNEK